MKLAIRELAASLTLAAEPWRRQARGSPRMLLCGVAAAVDVEDSAVDEAGLAACEVADGGGDLVRVGRAAGRGEGGELVQQVAHRLGALGPGRPGADRVDPYSARAELGGPGLGEQGQRRLARPVQGHACHSEVGD